MSESDLNSAPAKKLKLKKTQDVMEESKGSNILIPIGIIALAIVLIVGITRMLSSEKTYQDLVQDLESKTFGNRWVAAYELSKYMASNKIGDEDRLWLSENLSRLYLNEAEPRTRHFLILSLGALKDIKLVPIFEKAIYDTDEKIRYSAVVAISQLPKQKLSMDWSKIISLLESSQSNEDTGLKHVVMLTLSTHQISDAKPAIRAILRSGGSRLDRYNAALALLNYKDPEAQSTIEEILTFPFSYLNGSKNDVLKGQNIAPTQDLTDAQLEALKLNILTIIGKKDLQSYLGIVQKIREDNANIKVQTKAIEVLNKLKI
ncbi:hypothetical protein N9N67_05590 [Bacteriovoracaceae bacterium]|nr:hypothetical protein [Bacteriovoracaceae bacterium]